jgi:hypothetical protein
LAVLVAAGVLLVGLVGAGLCALGVLRVPTSHGDLVLETDDEDFAFVPARGGGLTLEDRKAKRTYHVQAVPVGQEDYELEITDAGADLSFKARTLTVKRGGKVALKAWFERKSDQPKSAEPIRFSIEAMAQVAHLGDVAPTQRTDSMVESPCG